MMKKVYILFIVIVSVLFILAGAIYAAQSVNGHQEKGVKCASCHKEDPPKDKVGTAVCLECHGDQKKVIERTNKYEPNPHVSPHNNKLVCEECHHEHKKSEISCQVCHVNMEFKK